MSNIPLARRRIEAIQDQLSEYRKKYAPRRDEAFLSHVDAVLSEVLTLMVREAPRHERAAPKARRVTEQVVINVLAFKQRHPHHSHFEIARRFGVNQGRVSEILSGKRDHLLTSTTVGAMRNSHPEIIISC